MDFFEEEAVRINEGFFKNVIKAAKDRFMNSEVEKATRNFATWYNDADNKSRFKSFMNSSIVKNMFKFVDNINGYHSCWHDLYDVDAFFMTHGFASTPLTSIPYTNKNMAKIKDFINENNLNSKNIDKNHFKLTVLTIKNEIVIYMDIDYKNI